MNDSATMHTGPLGSTIHVLHADAGTIAELAAVDWNRCFPMVCLDPVRRLITLMAPSRLHEDLAGILDDVVSAAGSAVTGASKGLRHTRLRRPGDPPGTGMEPDGAFYLGECARSYLAALAEGEAAADAYVEHTAPDLVVEMARCAVIETPGSTMPSKRAPGRCRSPIRGRIRAHRALLP